MGSDKDQSSGDIWQTIIGNAMSLLEVGGSQFIDIHHLLLFVVLLRTVAAAISDLLIYFSFFKERKKKNRKLIQ